MKYLIILLLLLISCSSFQSVTTKENLQILPSPTDISIQQQEKTFRNIETGIPEKSNLQKKTFEWKFNKEKYLLEIHLYQSLAQYYASLPRFITYTGEIPPDWEEQIYKQTLNLNDTEGFLEIFEFFNNTKINKKLSDDQFVDLVISFIQSIPYDYTGAEDPNSQLRNPYQTLFDQTGVCSDKTLVAAKILYHFGYGVALFLFNDENHMSLGIQCPKESSSYLSGYCYIETTAAELIGVAPELFSDTLTLKSQPRIIALQKGKQYTKAEENVKKEVKRREYCQQLPMTEQSIIEKEKTTQSLLQTFKMTNNVRDYANYRDAYTIYNRAYEKYKQIYAGCKGYEYTPQYFY